MVQQLKQVLAQKPKKALKLLQKMLKNIKKKSSGKNLVRKERKLLMNFSASKLQFYSNVCYMKIYYKKLKEIAS